MLPSPLAVDRAMMLPPTSATGSTDAQAASGFFSEAHSSRTAVHTVSPRAGSSPEGSDSIDDSLLNTIFSCVIAQVGP